jgi:hypothetical protein
MKDTKEVRKMTERLTTGVMKLVILAIVIIAVAGAMGEGVHELWNWLMPGIFHLPVIGYWQGVGLLALSWILFGGFGWLGRSGRGGHHRSRLAERWDHMSQEERAKFRECLRAQVGNQEAVKS